MTLIEWLTNDLVNAETQQLQAAQKMMNDHPDFLEWFSAEFWNFTLLYDTNTFAIRLCAIMINKAIEIDRIEKLTKFIKQKPITEDDLGNVITSTTESSANSSGKTSNSYSGYNVDNGEFSNTSNTADTTNKGTASTSSINRMGQLYNMANYELKSLYNNIRIDLFKLFQTIY